MSAMFNSPILLLLLILPHLALAERSETWPLGNGQELRCTVEERDGAVPRSLHILAPGQEPALVWSRQQTAERHWTDAIRYIYAAGSSGIGRAGRAVSALEEIAEAVAFRSTPSTDEMASTVKTVAWTSLIRLRQVIFTVGNCV